MDGQMIDYPFTAVGYDFATGVGRFWHKAGDGPKVYEASATPLPPMVALRVDLTADEVRAKYG